MNKTINKLFGQDLINALEEMLDDFVMLSYGEREIYKSIKEINESVRTCMYLIALDKNNKDLAFKLERVNNQLRDERLEDFKKAYKKDEHKKFLALLSKIDKQSLLKDLNIDVSDEEQYKLSDIQKEYRKVIKESLMQDQKVDRRDGIDRFIKYKKEVS